MDKKKKFATVTIIVSVILFVGVIPNSPAPNGVDNGPVTFLISSWSFPDEYGQGIDEFDVYENSTGAWVNVGGPTGYDEENVFDWNASIGIKLKVWSWFNSTFTGAGTTNEGKLLQQHSIIVTQGNGTVVFSQQNFTYSNVYTDDDPMWYYVYEVVLNFLPEMGQVYTATVTYEVYGVWE